MKKIMKKIATSLLLFCTLLSVAQRGKDGSPALGANSVVNLYTALNSNVLVGWTALPVANNAGFAPGDLILIIQMQGAQMDNNITWMNPADSLSYGDIVNYWDCGKNEFQEVSSISGSNTINIDCGLKYGYDAAWYVQVIRVPRYLSLTLNSPASIVAPAWNGTTGGVVAIEVQNNLTVNTVGGIDASARGFRGGTYVGDNNSTYGVNNVVHNDNQYGAEKGEGIVGNWAIYDANYGGRYCKGAPGNGGGGANAHNGGGGGGANAGNPAITWRGHGITDNSVAGWVTAWNREFPTKSAHIDVGGGKGGYTFSSSNNNQNATTTGPNNTLWGGDNRNYQGGFGGHILDYTTGRLFLGGGGGSGDQDNNRASAGASGGGLAYIMCYGNISGSGSVIANGGNANSTTTQGGNGIDGAGGGGGGGTIILNAVGTITTLVANANGGNGGNHQVTNPGIGFSETEGPGGGGGGGYIGVSGGATTKNVNGGANGVTNSNQLSEFLPNGATRGAPGLNNGAVTNFYYSIPSPTITICAGSTATFTANLAGSPPVGTTLYWYNTSVGGTNIGSGNTFTTPVLAVGTYTYYVGSCPGTYRDPVYAVVTAGGAAPIVSSNSPVCQGSIISFTTAAVGGGATYSWTGPNTYTSNVQNPTIPNAQSVNAGTYSLTITVGTCTTPSGTTTVVVNPIPTTPTATNNSAVCAGQTFTLTATGGAGNYNWTGPNTYTSTTQNPVVTNAQVINAGTYSVTLTQSGCTSLMGVTTVTVNPIPTTPTATNNSAVCAGQTFTLTATGGAGNYNWTGPNTYTSTTQNPVVTNAQVINAGTYSVTLTQSGCTSLMGVTTVTVNPIPIAPTATNDSPICSGQSFNLTSTLVNNATYNWTGPNSYTATTQNPNFPTSTVGDAGTYSVTVTVDGCTSIAAVTTVTITPGPNPPLATNDSPICAGAAFNLSSGTVLNATYNWTGPNSYTATTQNPNFPTSTVGDAGTYSVTITVNGCTSTAAVTTVTITPGPNPPLATNDSPICEGQSFNLTSTTILNASYNWTGPNTYTSTTQNPIITGATPAESGTYSITVTVNGCTSVAAVTTVTVNPAPLAPVAGNNSPVCVGAQIDLTANTIVGATYTWSGPNGFTSSSQNPSIIVSTLADAGTYTVTLSVGGCASTPTTVTVTVNASPAPAPTVSANNACAGQSFTLSANTTATTYTWTGPNGFTSSNQNPTISSATINESGTYTLVVSSAGCNSVAGTVSVTVNPLPLANFTSPNSTICTSDCQNFVANNTSGSNNYTWNFGDGSTGSGANVTHCYATAGIYSVSLVVTNSTTGCADSTGANNAVTVTDSPSAAFNISPSTIVDPNTNVGFTSSLGNPISTSYFWSFGDISSGTGDSSTFANPSHSYAQTGNYCITLIATNGTCADTNTTCIIVIGEIIINVPNVFTPNNDNINDLFFISSTGLKTLEVDVFDRWGLKMYSWTGFLDSWDGRTKNGKMAPNGVYYYMIKYTDLKDESKEVTGFLQLIDGK